MIIGWVQLAKSSVRLIEMDKDLRTVNLYVGQGQLDVITAGLLAKLTETILDRFFNTTH